MSPELLKLGQEALAAVAKGVAAGAPLLKCQLLASRFYEALRHELREWPKADLARRNTLSAAADQCDRAAIQMSTPSGLLEELKGAIDLLQADIPVPRPQARPVLRVIEGGLSRAGYGGAAGLLASLHPLQISNLPAFGESRPRSAVLGAVDQSKKRLRLAVAAPSLPASNPPSSDDQRQ